jgi:chorismate mutase/catechol 2,3-dioxygenase-like lactoylglutathione lyase family enzyme
VTESNSANQQPTPSLADLRQRIDDLDRQLVEVLTQRIAVCHEVARIKEHSDTPIIQPERVRNVLESRRQLAIDSLIDPDFVEDVMRVVLAETHRIEVAGRRPDAAPEKSALRDNRQGTPSDIHTALDTVATRIDHVVVTVDDLAGAVKHFTENLGFHVQATDDEQPGIAALVTGGVTIVLVSAAAGPAVADHLRAHGPGIHHVAIEVLNAGYARNALADTANLTALVDDVHGHEQFFSVRDPSNGVQLGYIARTGHRVGVATQNILDAFTTHEI